MKRTAGCVVLAAALVATQAARASQTRVLNVDGQAAMMEGDSEGISVAGDGVVRAGPSLDVLADGLAGPVFALARVDGQLYAATSNPGRVVRVDERGAVETIFESDKPLVTALMALDASHVVALTGPGGGAEIIDVSKRTHTLVATKEAKLLLGGVVVDKTVYAVGGTDEGLLLRLPAGASAFEVVARTKEESLRSIAVSSNSGKPRIVVGGGDAGVVYELVDGKLRSLLDAAPGEVTSVAVAPDGDVFAAFVDGEGKLSSQASTRARDDDDDKKKDAAARKVKSSEVWRIGNDGTTQLLWQSTKHAAYALALHDGHLLVGTGPQGRVWQLDPRGRTKASWIARATSHDEITSLLVDKDARAGVLAGTSHGAALLRLAKASARTAQWLSPSLDAGSTARFGAVRVRLARGTAEIAMRTGNTEDPDDTWSTWSSSAPASPDGASFPLRAARYAQVRATLGAGAELTGISVALLPQNRAPEINSIDVLAPGWKLVPAPREAPDVRSVSFADKAFARYLDRSGAQNPTLDERPYGKQSFDVGYRSVFASAEDADHDAMRYRFWLGVVDGSTGAGAGGAVSRWSLVQDWSDQPFYSLEATRLGDGDYRVRVDVDDLTTNGPQRALSDTMTSAPFVISHRAPRVDGASATRTPTGTRIAMKVVAALPLVVVRCTEGLGEWVPLDPSDGILDAAREAFDVELPRSSVASTQTGVPTSSGPAAVSCELYDEALNFTRVELPTRG